MHQINPKGLGPADPVRDASKILQPADVVWSRMTLEPGEVLLVKLSKHMGEHVSEIGGMISHCFKGKEDRVIVYVDGDVEITKALIR